MSTAINSTAQQPVADIALLLEGTYPFVQGGVSSWVHDIISGLPDLNFALVFLGGERDAYGKQKYELPDNVKHLQCHYLLDKHRPTVPGRRKGSSNSFDTMRTMHEQFKQGCPADSATLKQVFNGLGREWGVSLADFLHSEESWQMISEAYEQYCTDTSFVDYFWSVRTMHLPLFQLVDIARKLPAVRAVHSISTGYAGLLGAILHQQRQLPFILTEHGIYTKERKIDLANAPWIKEPAAPLPGASHEGMSYLRNMWIRFFEVLGELAYQEAHTIISLYDGNRQRQINDGAAEQKTLVVPNGISTEQYQPCFERRTQGIPPVVALVGRVVPIKDIKSFIRGMRIVCEQLPEAEGWIVGPTDEDEEYARECQELIDSLGLTARVQMRGFQRMDTILPQTGLLALTSISEALPLVALEAFAAGVPCIATDVGSCRELIYGRDKEDQELGKAGAIVPIANPDAFASEAVELLCNSHRWITAQKAGRQRAQKYYTRELMLKRYEKIYSKTLEQEWQA